MSHYRTVVVGLIFACAAAAQAKPAAPPPPKDPGNIAIINFQGAIADTAEGKQMLADMQKQFAPQKAQLAKYSEDITAQQKLLSNGASTMSDDAKAAMNTKIQQEQRDAQQLQQDTQSDVQTAISSVIDKVGTKMAQLIKEYAVAHGYAVVVDTSVGWPHNPVLFAPPGEDITKEIVAEYDSKYPAAAPASTGHE